MVAMKREATENVDHPSSAIMHLRDEALPCKPIYRQQRMFAKHSYTSVEKIQFLPTNPTSIDDLQRSPDRFRMTLAGDNFVLYDTFDDDEYDLPCRRITVLSTKAHLKIRTFKITPCIFFQLFSIMGSVVQRHRGEKRKIAIPLVHALLESKQECTYRKVIQVTLNYARNSGIRLKYPEKVMSGFELRIINAFKAHFSDDVVSLCPFYLCHRVYRKIQEFGLQTQYQEEDDESIREAARSMCALAFVTPEDVLRVFVRGIRASERKRAVRPRYEPKLWNMHAAVLQGKARTLIEKVTQVSTACLKNCKKNQVV